MKQGWEYKKLGEVCEIYQPRTLSTDMLTNTGNYPVYGANGIIGYYNQYNHKDQEVLLTCRGATCGTINISEPYSWINGNAMVIHRKSEEMLFKYLKYLMLSLDYSFIITGAAQPQITRQKLAPTKIGIPPKSTQLSIVSELDKINELIRLKKEQLKDYDNLAQSIFYEMFGDPVENEKGWEVKELGQLCEVTSSKRVFINEVVDAGVPFIRGTELTALNKLVPGEKMHYTLFITQEHYERLKAITGVPKVGDLLIPSINADGIVWMVDTEEPLYFKDGRVLWIHVNHNHFNSIAIQKLMNILIKNIYASMGGATFAELKLFVLRNMKVPIPPLSVQNAFAEKIKRIDIQKLQVKKSITDLETLLASRMQYWFE